MPRRRTKKRKSDLPDDGLRQIGIGEFTKPSSSVVKLTEVKTEPKVKLAEKKEQK